MKLISKATRRLHSLATYLEEPRLFNVRRTGGIPQTFTALDLPWFHEFGIRTVLDIGANEGQFAKTMLAVLPDVHVYSFEPLPDCFARMQAELSKQPRFTGLNIGVGDAAGKLAFERNAYSPSSSFLPMAKTHQEAFPFTQQSRPVTVDVIRLDDIAQQLKVVEPLLIKIDVQGYELHVLRGGEATVQRARMLFVETSFTTLYEEQPLFDDVYRVLTGWGFEYVGALDQLRHPGTERILQADSIFVKR